VLKLRNLAVDPPAAFDTVGHFLLFEMLSSLQILFLNPTEELPCSLYAAPF
jgi:hypothetical protein